MHLHVLVGEWKQTLVRTLGPVKHHTARGHHHDQSIDGSGLALIPIVLQLSREHRPAAASSRIKMTTQQNIH